MHLKRNWNENKHAYDNKTHKYSKNINERCLDKEHLVFLHRSSPKKKSYGELDFTVKLEVVTLIG